MHRMEMGKTRRARNRIGRRSCFLCQKKGGGNKMQLKISFNEKQAWPLIRVTIMSQPQNALKVAKLSR